MSLQFNCPYCQLLMSADPRFAGGQVQCPSCHQLFMVGATVPVVPVVQARQVPQPLAQAPAAAVPARPPQPAPPQSAAPRPATPQPPRPAQPRAPQPGRPAGARPAAKEEGNGMVYAAIVGVILAGVGVIYGGVHLIGTMQSKPHDPYALPPEVIAREAAQKAVREKEKREQEAEEAQRKQEFTSIISELVCGGNDKVAAELVKELAAIKEELNGIYADADPNNTPHDLREFYTAKLSEYAARNPVIHHWLGGRPASTIAETLWGGRSQSRQHGQVADFLMGGAYASSGTGFFVSSDGWLLTNEHVVDKATEVDIRGADGVIRKARVVQVDEATDVALLKAEDAPAAWLNLGSDDAAMGGSVFTIGFPNATVQGVEPKFTDGRVSSLTGFRDDKDQYQVTVPVQPGNSGGPLVDMKSGQVVGIVSSILSRESGADNVSYAVKGSVVRRLVAAVPQAQSAAALPAGSPAGADVEAMAAKVKSAVVLILVK